jgi:glycosyl transferase family 87
MIRSSPKAQDQTRRKRSPVRGLPWTVLVLGLLLRLVLAPYTSDSNDVATWFQTSLAGFHGLHLYDRAGFSYPPLWGYCLQIVGWLVHFVGLGPSFFGVYDPNFSTASTVTTDFSTFVTSPLYNLAFKSILFGCDVLIGILIVRLVGLITEDVRRARAAFAIWFLNPFVIYESAVHGAADNLVGFAVLATVALALAGGEFWAGVAWVSGILTKLSPAAIGLQLLITLWTSDRRARSIRGRLLSVALFGAGTLVAGLVLLLPELTSGSVPGLIHSTLARSGGGINVGGLSFMGIRHFKQWSWIFIWAYDNSSLVVRASLIAQAVSGCAWAIWTWLVIRRNRAFALLSGTVGTLASAMLLAPNSNPQYVLWWLPALVVLAVITGRGYWQIGVISVAALVFELAVLGPEALLAPLATYTGVVHASAIGDDIVRWYVAPGRFTGLFWTDDFFGPAALVTVVALLSLFAAWMGSAMTKRDPVLTGIRP